MEKQIGAPFADDEAYIRELADMSASFDFFDVNSDMEAARAAEEAAIAALADDEDLGPASRRHTEREGRIYNGDDPGGTQESPFEILVRGTPDIRKVEGGLEVVTERGRTFIVEGEVALLRWLDGSYAMLGADNAVAERFLRRNKY